MTGSFIWEASLTVPFFSIETQLPPPLRPVIGAYLTTLLVWIGRCIEVIAEAGIADALGNEPRTAAELAAATHCHADSLDRMLRLLASVGVYERQPDGRYAHSPTSRLMRADHPASAARLARLQNGALYQTALARLEHSLRTGETAIGQIAPDGLCPYLASHPEEATHFRAAMSALTAQSNAAVLASYDFGGYATIADIGGGEGRLLAAILDQAPSARGILVDLPEVLARPSGVTHDRLRRNPADFLRDELPRAHLYLLKYILHDWADAEARTLLQRIRRAAPTGARLLVADAFISEEPGLNISKLMDVGMLAVLGGRERTREQHEKLLTQTGFRVTALVPTPDPALVMLEAEAV
jgi:hypothetical protein